MITKSQLKQCMPYATKRNIELYWQPLNDVMKRYAITTPLRISAFLAQLCHESGSLRYVEELASGKAYEGRLDLGNTQPGDGIRFKGRGLIQITGRANYAEFSKDSGIPAISNPKILSEPIPACTSAGWYWDKHQLNELADAGNFRRITYKINGGYNGEADRVSHYLRCKRVFGLQ